MKTVKSIVAASLLSLGCIVGANSGNAQAFNGAAGADACAGVTAQLGQEGAVVEHVNDLRRQTRIGRAVVIQPSGAQVFVRAEPGMSAAYLQRVVNCQASAGMGAGPLSVPGVKATVVEQGQHFVVQILAPNLDSAKEVQQRARALAAQ